MTLNLFFKLQKDWERAAAAVYLKYGEMQPPIKAEFVLMKQKHRMIWERRNGPLPFENIEWNDGK